MSVEGFLAESPLAGRVALPTRIVIHRRRLTAAAVEEIRRRGRLDPIPEEERVCELEAGGMVVARGRLVRRRGDWYFKVTETRR